LQIADAEVAKVPAVHGQDAAIVPVGLDGAHRVHVQKTHLIVHRHGQARESSRAGGIGLGFLLPNYTLFMQMLAPQRDVGVASALIQTTRALGSAFGTALVGMVVARLSVSLGVTIGLVLCVAMSILIAVICAKIRMKNVSRA
jgi:MFS family permease